MRYRNVKTGAIIKTTGKVVGKNWEPLEENLHQQPDMAENPFDENLFEEDVFEDDTPEEETVAEEAPAEKPKPSRKGKK